MKSGVKIPVLCVVMVLVFSALAFADNEVEGRIESISYQERSIVVQGMRFYATESTDYDDGLRRFEDLKVGQKVEIDFVYRGGKHFIKEIELDD
ncbi:MAG: hypothetical protein GX751_02495 [Desulfuromonadaceae bacterium]|nr:hypothetical protein [Desulfuromonadaceae bacterium]